jgi:hypothetical protein
MKLLRALSLVFFFALVCGLTLFAAWSHQNKELYPTGIAASNWRPLVNPWRMNQGVVAYYSFQDEQLDKGQIRNRKTIFPTTRADFKFSQEQVPCRVVEGRWPGKQAIELDQGTIKLPTTGVSGATFAISFWIRHCGPGSIVGDNASDAASIAAASSGMWHGWRIDLLFPSNRIAFSIARKRGQPIVGVVSALRVPPRTWTHIAITREPQRIRIYVNGMLSGETKHDVSYSPLPNGSSFKLGYVGNGLSSAIVQYDDILLLSYIPATSFFLSQAQLESIDSLPLCDQWESASESFLKRDYDKAIEKLTQLKNNIPYNSKMRYWADFRLAEALFRLNKRQSAIQYYLDIRLNPNAPENIRLQALHEYLLIHEGVNDESDPEFYAYNSPLNFYPSFGEIAPASYRYRNAVSDYDYYIPLNENKMQSVD